MKGKSILKVLKTFSYLKHNNVFVLLLLSELNFKNYNSYLKVKQKMILILKIKQFLYLIIISPLSITNN